MYKLKIAIELVSWQVNVYIARSFFAELLYYASLEIRLLSRNEQQAATTQILVGLRSGM